LVKVEPKEQEWKQRTSHGYAACTA
jgi:hypothetical protein